MYRRLNHELPVLFFFESIIANILKTHTVLSNNP
jgi:hypothetical protein